jgi:phage recombination protein Bet
MSIANNQLPSNVTNINELTIDNNIINVLRETIYPGAKDESILMVLNYCKARRLDPLKRPVHLVPMSVKTGEKDAGGKDVYRYRDVVMPGIGQYRTDADRSGLYAGMSEPEFGEDITEQLGSIRITYPKWCKITVSKYVGDRVVGFTAKEFWKENYATKSRSDITPNAMWEKRTYGQLAKCVEAQALRKAFPDAIGNELTAEEMQGKHFPDNHKVATIEATVIDNAPDLIDKFNDLKFRIEMSETENELKLVFSEIKNINFKTRPDLHKQLVDAKDKRKSEITVTEVAEQTINTQTGEVLS